nr:hypothetical protein [uncultured Shinella sp.]
MPEIETAPEPPIQNLSPHYTDAPAQLGVDEKQINIRNKPHRGKFTAAFFYMSRGDKYAGAAIGLVVGVGLTLLFIAVPLILPNNEAKHPSDGTQIQQLSDKQLSDSGSGHSWLNGYEGYVYTEDSLAQWSMAVFAVIATGISFLAVVYVKDSLTLNREAVDAALAANSTTKEIGVAQARAYISITGVDVDFHQIGNIFTIRLRLKNAGNSPARSVSANVTLKVFSIGSDGNSREWLWGPIQATMPDIGSGDFGPYPIEFHENPVSDAIARTITGMEVNMRVSGRDVFNNMFVGGAVGMIAGSFVWSNTQRFAFVKMVSPVYADSLR